MQNFNEDILLQVRKPARYLGNEWNVVKKDFLKAKVKFAICFPDLYEVGMSNLGLRIIYGLLNAQEDVSCERVFLPDLDMLEILRARRIPLFSLESRMPLVKFDFIGFALSYELDYTNILAMLDLSGIPLLASQRNLDFPLVIAGGSCASNPEPLADFIDLFLIGEAEEALPEIIERYKKLQAAPPLMGQAGQDSGVSKEEILIELAKVEGVYVPSLYEVEYDSSGAVKKFSPKYPGIPQKVRKRIVKNLDQAYYPTNWLVPHIQIVHDRACIELMRGCPHHCKFCQARAVYHSLRLRSPQKVLELTKEVQRLSGYEELSFLSLSTSDYPNLFEVISSLTEKFQEQAIAISLPSIRPKAYLGDLAVTLAKVRKTTLTFAPEAGSVKLRSQINKDFNMEEFYAAVFASYKAGWRAIKLYFIIGLPNEDYEDLDGILEIAQEVCRLRKEAVGRPAEVRLSICLFIPKPHTPFEREAMEPQSTLRAKILYLRKKAASLPRAISLKFHNLESSIIEAVFSRGDRTLGSVLLKAYKRGCLLDAWPEYFKFDLWRDVFKECNKLPDSYLSHKSSDEILPWQHIVLT
jgi:radical SAM family uncharacterized protein